MIGPGKGLTPELVLERPRRELKVEEEKEVRRGLEPLSGVEFISSEGMLGMEFLFQSQVDVGVDFPIV